MKGRPLRPVDHWLESLKLGILRGVGFDAQGDALVALGIAGPHLFRIPVRCHAEHAPALHEGVDVPDRGLRSRSQPLHVIDAIHRPFWRSPP